MGNIYSIYLEVSGFDQTLFEKVCVATPEHATVRDFSVKPFFQKGCAQALFEKGCVESFDHADHVVARVFGQAFFQKGCAQAFFSKGLT